MRGLLERLGLTLRERDIDAPIRGASLRGLSRVLLVPSGYHPRDEFTIAHEIIESFFPSEWNRYAATEEDKERACDRGAAALLLPAAEFHRSVTELRHELPALRRRWRNASWDVIARRLVDVGAASTAAAWDSLELRWRYGGTGHDAEEHALAEVYAGRGSAHVRAGEREVRAWRLGGAGLGRAVSVGR